MKVLLVDDDDTIQEYVKELLESSGFEFDSALDISEFQEKVKNNIYDLVLLDINLGGGNEKEGINLCEVIKKQDPKIAVIMFTARDIKDFKLESFSLGADDYITKPFDADEFLARVRRVLSRYGKTVESPEIKLRKVLIIEDDESMQNILTNLLKKNGFLCYISRTTEEALKRIYEINPDLVLLDLLLTGEKEHSSLQFLTFIKQTKKELPVVIITGHYQEPADKTLGLNLGADDYILKPIEPDEFIARINTVIKGYGK
jgi:DNA-binding response OmpR family regulator